jgi:hypothetical protein
MTRARINLDWGSLTPLNPLGAVNELNGRDALLASATGNPIRTRGTASLPDQLHAVLRPVRPWATGPPPRLGLSKERGLLPATSH